MKRKLDFIDHQIISLLQQNARMSLKDLASQIYLSSPATSARLEKLEREGYKVELLDVNSNGVVSVAQLERAIREDTCLVTVMYANNEIGSIQPISEIGTTCWEKGVTFHTDAVQAAGHLPVDVKV